jgi:hypothetical protein
MTELDIFPLRESGGAGLFCLHSISLVLVSEKTKAYFFLKNGMLLFHCM